MADVDDLHAAFARLEELVPDDHPMPEPHRPPARRPVRHRAIITPILAVAAVAAVALWVAVLSRNDGGADGSGRTTSTQQQVGRPGSTAPARPAGFGAGLPAPASGTATSLALSFSVAPVAGFSFQPVAANRLYQRVGVGIDALTADQSQDVARGGDIFLFYRGVFDPSSVPHLARVSVGGRPGFVTRTGIPTEVTPTSAGTDDGIVWQYASDAWALVSVDRSAYQAIGKNTRQQNLALARAVRPDSVTLRVPFRLGYVPAGLYAEGADASVLGPPGRLMSVTGIGFGDGHPRSTSGPIDAYAEGSALSVSVNTALGYLVCKAGCHFVQAGRYHAGVYTAHGQVTQIATMVGATTITIAVDSSHLGRWSAAQLQRMLTSLTLAAKPIDRATWFDATTVVP